jgi:uncharacterized membrane protein/uncharacterized protein YjeT (DUF2065 family)
LLNNHLYLKSTDVPKPEILSGHCDDAEGLQPARKERRSMAIQQTKRALAPRHEQPAKTDVSAAPRRHQAQNDYQPTSPKQGKQDQLAMALGWFSIGLGLAEVLAPKGLAKLIGARKTPSLLLRSMGVREIIAGVGILTNPRPARWLWARVAGDAIDLSVLGAAFMSDKAEPGRLIAATAAVAGVTALDVIEAQRLSLDKNDRVVRVASRTINRSPEEVYKFWRNFQNLPRFMSHLESVQVTGENRSHWKATAPAGMTVEWDAEIVEDRPNELIAWRSLEGADVEHSGSVRFQPAPGNRGTEVKVSMVYNPPGGVLGVGIAKLFGEEPGEQIKGDLYRFKQVMETGEVIHSDSSIHPGMHAAQPSGDDAEK